MPARTRYRMVATKTGGVEPRDHAMRELDQSNTAYTAMSLPAPLYYQPANAGHEAAMTVGAVEEVTLTADEVTATGYFLDGDEDEAEMPRIAALAREAVGMAKRKLVRPSVDPGVIEIGENEHGEPALTKADLSGVTLVGMQAFTDAAIDIIEADAEAEADEAGDDIPADMPAPTPEDVEAIADEAAALVAAVRREGWSDMTIAGRDREWDGAAAAGRLAELCGVDDDDAGAEAWNCYARGFLWLDSDNQRTKGAYKLGIVDVEDGERVIVPRAVFAVAAVLEGGRGGVDIPETDQATIRGVLDGLYARMADEFDDDSLTPPWAEASARMAALVAAVAEAPPAEAFGRPEDIGPAFDGYRIEGKRIFGNLYPVGACHLNWQDKCVTAPESPSGYALFRRYGLTTTAGEIPVGRITTGLGKVGTGCACCDPERLDDHACPRRMGLVAAMAHHDRMETVADVNIGEHDGAIWLSGIIRDDLSAEAERVLARRVWSGDWRPAGDADELVEVLALHHGQPAFATHVAHSRSRGVLIASTGPTAPAPAAGLSAADVGPLVARTVQGLDAARALEAAITDAGRASALATLTELERL